MTEDTVTLGGNIELTGFKELDGASMVVVKKLVGSYARKFSDGMHGFEKLNVTLNKNGKYALSARLKAEGQEFVGESAGENLFFVLDQALKDLESKAAK
jgi:hypothetical protein